MKRNDILLNSLGLLFFIIPIMLMYSNTISIGLPFLFNLISLLSPVYLLIVNIITNKMNKGKHPAWRIIPCLIILLLGFVFSCLYANFMGELKLASLICILFVEFSVESIVVIMGLTIYQMIILMLHNKKQKK